MRWPIPFRRGNPNPFGYVEAFDGRILRGWAWDGLPRSHLCLDVFARGIYAGRARTGGFRADLQAQGIGDGRHAFTFHMPAFLCTPDLAMGEIAVFPSGSRRLPRIGEAAPHEPAPDTPAAVFGRLIDVLAGSPASDRCPAKESSRVARLLAATPGDTSAFVAHIARKYGRSAPTGADRAFWTWYLEEYGVEKGPARAPLSTADIDAIDALRLAPHTKDWAIDGARRLFVEDRLVASSLRDQLRRASLFSSGQSFPLSRYMRMFRAGNALLRSLPTSGPDERIAIYACVMLYAVTDPHILAYVPTRWLQAMLDGEPGCSPFERAQHKLLGHALPPDAFTDHLRRQGFDVGGQSFRCFAPTGSAVDVQVIGPFSRSLGLGESCRRLAAALGRTGHTLNLVDYDIGVASRRTTDLVLAPIRPARVNILHLNAEEVPEAIAFLPDVFTDAHTILMPYWELSRPSRVHELGMELVDEIWVASRYLEEVFATAGKPATRVGMAAHGDPADRAEGRAALRSLGIPDGRFVFLTTSDALSWAQRKNVLGVVDAFQAAFPTEPVSLLVKTRNIEASLTSAHRRHWATISARCASDARIVLLDADLGGRAVRALRAGCDALVSLHRAEGLGLDLLDAVAEGTPVVTTAYSGPMDFCDAGTAWLVDYDLVGVEPDDYAFVEPGQVWAAPRLASAIEALRGVVTDAEGRARRAAAGRARAAAEWSDDGFTARLKHALAGRLSAS